MYGRNERVQFILRNSGLASKEALTTKMSHNDSNKGNSFEYVKYC